MYYEDKLMRPKYVDNKIKKRAKTTGKIGTTKSVKKSHISKLE